MLREEVKILIFSNYLCFYSFLTFKNEKKKIGRLSEFFPPLMLYKTCQTEIAKIVSLHRKNIKVLNEYKRNWKENKLSREKVHQRGIVSKLQSFF